MIHRIIAVASVGVLGYFVLMQLYLLTLALISAFALDKERMLERFGRIDDMLVSDVSPPVSIVLPAYNEEVGVVESVRSVAMISYPRFEIVVVNDGSNDGTLQKLIDTFNLVPVPLPFRANIPTAQVGQVYHSTRPVSITVVDKLNGGRADALNAGINVARFPYVMLTDADVLIDGKALVNAMRHVVEDRDRTVAVGGNIRPLNGCVVKFGHIVEANVPESAGSCSSMCVPSSPPGRLGRASMAFPWCREPSGSIFAKPWSMLAVSPQATWARTWISRCGSTATTAPAASPIGWCMRRPLWCGPKFPRRAKSFADSASAGTEG